MTVTETKVLGLDDGSVLDREMAGSKAATLARLRMAGFAVPDGLVLPVGAGSDGPAAMGRAAAERFDGPVAVRSSAPWEDLATTARAGQSLTVLGVEGAGAVESAAARCRATVLDARPRRGGIAVLVQPMVQPSHAGVAFTADPLTGARDVVRIASTVGLGDRLVGGEVDGKECLVRGQQVLGEPGSVPLDQVREIARVAREIELLLGGPQDVEWAIADGVVHVLQARPITVLPTPPAMPTGGGWQKDVAHYSEPLTPFGYRCLTMATAPIAEVFAEAGLLIEGLEEHMAGGEVYSRVRPAVGSAEPAPFDPPAVVLGLLARIAPPLRARTAAARRMIEQDLGAVWVQEWIDRRPAYEEQVQACRSAALDALSVDELIAHLRQLVALVSEGGRQHFRVFIPYTTSAHALHVMLAGREGWDETDTLALLSGASPATTASRSALAEIQTELASSEPARAALGEMPQRPVAALAAVDAALAAKVRTWMDEHGGRAMNYDAGTPVLAERPSLVTRLLLTGQEAAGPDPAEAAAARARSLLPAPEHPAFERALAEARSRYPWREDTVILAGDVPLGLLRAWLVEVGIRLVESNLLGDVEDAAYLVPDELVEALRGRVVAADLQAEVVRRRGEEAWTRANPGPLTIGRQSGPPDVSRLPEPLRRMNEPILWMVGLEYPGETSTVDVDGVVVATGMGVSPGVVEGTVRVIRDQRDLDRLMDGEVLVCTVTSPAWAPLLPLVSAVVADAGGAMSHAAIAAREHGIPAVLATQTGTRDLTDGMRVRVDGAAGTVVIVEG